ncbi:MAG: AbrB/MazE/SpoVT family DNA-binding domain-containing protein [Candidatus Lokiarchaeia archaeon]
MDSTRESDVVVVSSKSQVVIPKSIREKLGIRPKTKLLVYSFNDVVIMKKLKVPDLSKELEELYEKIDSRIAMQNELSEEEIKETVQKYRTQKS